MARQDSGPIVGRTGQRYGPHLESHGNASFVWSEGRYPFAALFTTIVL